VTNIVQSYDSYYWMDGIGEWRKLAGFVRSGRVGELSGRTSEQAENDCRKVQDALLAFHQRTAEAAARGREARRRISALSWEELVPALDVLKWENHETLLKAPASSQTIREAEDLLGIELQQDYKQFLSVSNGIEFMPSINAPGFRSAEGLRWQTAEELGLDEFRVDLGCQTDPAEYDKLPKMDKILMISDEDSEEQMWYVHPDSVAEASRILKEEGRDSAQVMERACG
jgi:hypothetical protein